MTQTKQMMDLVKATGGDYKCSKSTYFSGVCNAGTKYCNIRHPSPVDLNDLFMIADRLEVDFRISCTTLLEPKYDCVVKTESVMYLATKSSPADALRDALWQALKGEE